MLKHDFVSLVAIMDWYGRTILSWELLTTIDRECCISALERAFRFYGTTGIFNSDQISQWTDKTFRDKLEDHGVGISMDGQGLALDNSVIERFWRILTYGEVLLKEYANPMEFVQGIRRYIDKYHSGRPHDSLGKRTADDVYVDSNNGLNQTEKC